MALRLTILQGVGPNSWWICVRINWLAMDLLDHHNPGEQCVRSMILKLLTIQF